MDVIGPTKDLSTCFQVLPNDTQSKKCMMNLENARGCVWRRCYTAAVSVKSVPVSKLWCCSLHVKNRQGAPHIRSSSQ